MKAMDEQLHEHRLRAAKISGGISSNAIYATVERLIVSMDIGGAALDFGAGIGNFTRRLVAMDRFASVSAADAMGKPQNLGSVSWIEQDLNEPIEGYDQMFDVVFAIEVIEHLENPRATMRQIARVLRPGGTAIVTTPNNESLRSLIALLIRGHYAAFGADSYPAHITALLRKDLTRIFQEGYFSSPAFYFSDDGGIPGRPALHWQKISLGLLRGLRFSDNLIAAAEKLAWPQ